MPRMSAEHKADTHRRIVMQASRTFRSDGSSASILPLMESVGLTHGGFYKHFTNKDDLFLESLGFSFEEAAQQFENAAAAAQPGEEVAAIIDSYLRIAHVKHPEFGCAMATLGTDIARQQPQTRQAAQGAIKKFVAKMSRFMPGTTAEDRVESFYVLFSALMGAVIMARMVSEVKARDRILERNRQFLKKSFAVRRTTTKL